MNVTGNNIVNPLTDDNILLKSVLRKLVLKWQLGVQFFTYVEVLIFKQG